MPEAHLEVALGSVKFLGEGSEGWLSQQLEKFLKGIPAAASPLLVDPPSAKNETDRKPVEDKPVSNLPTYLQEVNATTNQVRKFLATAVWLQDRSNGADTNTADVTKALRDSRQSRLTNAAECLNKNVGKGYCEKTPSGFFVTGQGKSSLKN